jgi:hypothetical protein
LTAPANDRVRQDPPSVSSEPRSRYEVDTGCSLTDQRTAARGTARDFGHIDFRIVERIKIRLHDKRAALVDLGRHIGLFDIKHRVEGRLKWGARVPEKLSRASSLASLPPDQQAAVIAQMTDPQLEELRDDWSYLGA